MSTKPQTKVVVEDPQGKQLVKIADRVRDQLLLLHVRRQREIRRHLENLLYPLGQLQEARHRLALCLDQEWHVAAGTVTNGIGRMLMELSVNSDVLERSLDLSEVGVPSLRDVVADLEQARQEFPGLRYYPQEKILAVVTEAVELEETFLGDFEIQVHLSELGSTPLSHSYRIVALDPHAAAGDDRVTHPHVRDQFLCAGEGATAIHTALASGRLCDFFSLAWSVLSNYNPDSPYISLANWSGRACHECGYVTHDDDLYFCDSCENDVCGECSTYCTRCDCTVCVNCQERCPVCNESVCSGCMTKCSECDERLCTKCQEESKCPCLEEEEEEIEDESNTNEVPVGGEGAAGTQPADEGEEFCIVHVNDVIESTGEGPKVGPA